MAFGRLLNQSPTICRIAVLRCRLKIAELTLFRGHSATMMRVATRISAVAEVPGVGDTGRRGRRMFRTTYARHGGLPWFALVAAAMLAGCTGPGGPADQFGSAQPPAPTQGTASAANTIGTGPVKVALVLPLTASGNAGTVAQSMRNGAELAMAQFESDIQVLARDDAGNAATAQQVSAAGGRRGRRDHSRAAVLDLGSGGRSGRARAQCSGDRVLDRLERRRSRRLSVEPVARIRRHPHRRLRDVAGQTIVSWR